MKKTTSKKPTPKKATTSKSALRRPVDDAAKKKKFDATIESDLGMDQVDVKNFIIKKEEDDTLLDGNISRDLSHIDSIKQEFEKFLETLQDEKLYFTNFSRDINSLTKNQITSMASQRKLINILFGVCAVILFISILITTVAVFSFSSKSSDFRIMSDALATRIVNMNTGLDQFQNVQEEISNLYNIVEMISLESEKTNDSIVAFKDEIATVFQRLQNDLSTKYEESITEQIDSYNNLQDRFSTINSRMLSLENAFEETSEADLAFFAEMKRLENFVNQIDALILLEKEKYLDQIRLSQEIIESEEGNLNNDPKSFAR
jgi:hypothetical protein